MVSLDWSTDRTDGVTLVTLRVESPEARRVRVENRIDGPVWPPRRQGRPAAGWNGTGYEGVVEAGGVLALGYATPGEPVEPPAEVVAAEPPGDGDEADGDTVRDADSLRDPATVTRDAGCGGIPGREREVPSPADRQPVARSSTPGGEQIDDRTPAGVVRSLGDPVVPREAVPVPDATADTTADGRPTGSDGSTRSADAVESPASGPASGGPERARPDQSRPVDRTGCEALPARLAAIERRLAALER